jgi:hypothetical protein
MKFIIILAFSFSYLVSIAQEGRSVGRKYSKALLEQEKYFEQLKKPNGELYGNKEVAFEIKLDRIVKVEINNTSRNIEIKPWDEQKVKLTTQVYLDGKETQLDNNFWLEKLKVKTKLVGNKYIINIEGLNENNNNNTEKDNVEIYSVEGKVIKTENAKKQPLIIYVPKYNKLEVNSKYATVLIASYIFNIKANITNGSFELKEANSLGLISKYANVTIEKTDSANIDFINGELTIEQANSLLLDSKYSNQALGNINYATITSTNDEIAIEEVKQLTTTKNYGILKIGTLKEGLAVEGVNAPLQIGKIENEVKYISIDNKYTDLKLPLQNCKSFNINFKGTYSTIQKNFLSKENIKNSFKTEGEDNDVFKATIGRGELPININCINCTVDFR